MFALTLALLVTSAAFLWVRRQPHRASQPVQEVTPSTTQRVIEHPHIGLLLPREGPFGNQGKMLESGVKLARRELQDQGISTRLIVRDSGANFQAARQAAEELAADPDMLLVIAHLPAAVLAEIMPAYAKKQLLLLAPGSSHQNLVGHPWLLPLVASDRRQAAWAAAIIQHWTTGKRAALIHSTGSYGGLLYRSFKDEAQRIGLDFTVFTCGTGDADPTRTAAELLRQDQPAAIWLAGPPLWGAKVVKALVKRDYQGRFLAPSSYGEPFVENLFGTYPGNLFVLRPVPAVDQEDAAMQSFRKAFSATYWRSPDGLAVLGYDTMHWIGEALRHGSQTRMAVRDFFLQADSPQHAHRGIAGTAYFDSSGRIQRPPYLTMWRDGRLKPAPDPLCLQQLPLANEQTLSRD